MATIKDVSKFCGVSVATVSRVINRDANVRESTRRKVLEAIDELHYVPNAIAKNLRTDKTKRILVLLAGISNQFYSKVLVGMERRAEEDGYRTAIAITHNNADIERQCFENLKMHFYDGVVSLSSALDSEYLNDIYDHFPIAFCSEYVENTKIPYIGVDNEKAGYDATKFYIDQGFTKIAFIGTKLKYGSAAERELGYKKALSDAEIPENKDYIFYGNYSFDAGETAGRHFLSLPKMPQAIFSISDAMAIGAMRELIKNGIKIGKEVHICGFDNTKISEVYMPSLTTVSQPRFEIGYTVMDRLIRRIETGEKMETIKLTHKIIVRES